MSNFKVLTLNNQAEIVQLEHLKISDLDEVARMQISWKAPWRSESLEFYLKTGWCIGFYNEAGLLLSYFLAQPLLFTESYTQSLWIEYISYPDETTALQMIDFAYKYGRDKHLQRVLFNYDEIFERLNLPFKVASLNKKYLEVFTTKMS